MGPLGPLGPHGGPWGPHGAPWGPLGPLGPLGAQIRPGWGCPVSQSSPKLTFWQFLGQIRPGWGCPVSQSSPKLAFSPRLGVSSFAKFTKICIFAFFGSKMVKQKVEIEGAGPPWRDSQRNSAPGPGPQVPNGATATHLVTKRCDLGSLGVPGCTRTPLGPRGGEAKIQIQAKIHKGASQIQGVSYAEFPLYVSTFAVATFSKETSA